MSNWSTLNEEYVSSGMTDKFMEILLETIFNLENEIERLTETIEELDL